MESTHAWIYAVELWHHVPQAHCMHASKSQGLFTKERITFRKPFRIAIRFLIGFVIWTTCVHKHCKRTPSQSRTGSAHCEVIFCSYCAVRADWPMHGFSVHFQNAHTRITFRKSFAFTCPQNQAFYDPKCPLYSVSKAHFKSLIWKSFAFTKGKIRLSNQERVRFAFQNGFRNVIPSFVNRPTVAQVDLDHTCLHCNAILCYGLCIQLVWCHNFFCVLRSLPLSDHFENIFSKFIEK